MFESAYIQLRFGASLLFARPFDLPSLNRLIDALMATRREFGTLTGEANELLAGPILDDEIRRDLQLRRFRTQLKRAIRETPRYAALLAHLDLAPHRLTFDDIAQLPLTTKAMVRDGLDDFVRRGQEPTLHLTTTDTLGKQTNMLFTHQEMAAYIALGALTYLLQESVSAQDIVQVSTSARAMLGNTVFIGACQRVGALVYQTGIVDPERALAQLAERYCIPTKKARTSVLLTYPSYLGKLVETGLRLGYGPDDFGLEQLHLGGEIVTEGVKQRCRALFGPVKIHQSYGVTEVWPLGGTICEQGHLHFEPGTGLVEIIDPETGRAVQPGEVGSLVLTPFAPYREAIVMLRYDTTDQVRRLTDPLSCSLKHFPATSNILGKRRLSVRHACGWTYPRDLLEAIEAVDDLPLPARCGFWALNDGVAVEVAVPRITLAIRCQIEARLKAHGVPVRALHLVSNPAQLRNPLPWRSDLAEGSLTASPLGSVQPTSDHFVQPTQAIVPAL